MKKKILSIACVLVSAITFAQIPTSGLVAHYPFNGNANDESTNSNDGTVNGATLTTDRFGNVNSAYSFDGVNDEIRVDNIVGVTNTWTPSFWFNSLNSSTFEQQNVIGLGSSPSIDGGAGFQINGGVAACPIFNSHPNEMNLFDASSGCEKLIFADSYSNNYWYHVTIVNENGNYKIYVNSNLVATGTINSISINELYFGNRDAITFQWFKGEMDDIRIYSSALDLADVQALYNENTCTNVVTVQDTLNIYLSSIITTVYEPADAATTVKVYPNPTENEVTVSIDNYTNLSGVTLKVINSQSAEVHSEAVTGPTQSIDVSSWSAGIYFLQVLNGVDIVDIRKIVVNN